MAEKKTTEKYLEEAKNVHGNKIDFSSVIYTGRRNKIKLKCNICGHKWETRADVILQSCGCPSCVNKERSEKIKMPKEVFIKRANEIHNHYYDYSKVNFDKVTEKVIIVCSKHGEFEQVASEHLRGHGCPICGHYKKPQNGVLSNIRLTNEEFDKKLIEYDRKDIVRVGKYNSNKKPLKFKCLRCGKEFTNRPINIINNNEGCPYCASSKLESEVRKYLTEHKINFEEQKTFIWLKAKRNLRIDFYLPDYKIAIECQGDQHYKPVDFGGKGIEWAKKQLQQTQKLDKIKKTLCENNGIKMLYYLKEDKSVLNRLPYVKMEEGMYT